MTLVLDAGALIAVERGNRTVRAVLEGAWASGTGVRTTSGVVAQVWRVDSRQARLALLLGGVAEVELTSERARRVGVLLGLGGTADVVDGSVVDAALDGDEILTSDPDDLVALIAASRKAIVVTPV